MSEKKIKICALTTISKTMDWFVVDSMRNLAKNGYEVTLISNMDEGFAQRNSDYAKCIHFPMSRGTSIKDLITMPFKLAKIFKKEDFDIIYYMSPNVSLYASIAGILAGRKVRVYAQAGIRYVSLGGVSRKIFKFIEKMTCVFSTHVKGQSPKNMQFAIDEKLCPKKKISVVGIGGTIGVELDKCMAIDVAQTKNQMREKYNVPQNAFVYGYVGRINTDKGINELIEAFCQVEKQVPTAYLVLVGMYDDANPISEENLAFAKSKENIIMTGNVPPSEVYSHMAMFDVLVHPTYREGFGKVLQEAMGMKLPIITTDVPGPSEVIENNISGILCEVKNPVDLGEKMILLQNDSSLAQSFAQAGFERETKYFDRPIMLNNILQDMNRIMKLQSK